MAAIPSANLISNLAAAQQSLDKAKQAHKNWMERNEKNKEEIQQALARKAALDEESVQREHDIAEGTKNLQAATAAFVQASTQVPAPVALQLPASPSPKRLTKQMKETMTPEQKKAHKAAKKTSTDERRAERLAAIAAGDEKAIAEQAQIDARVAKMQAALAASRAAKKAIHEAGDDLPALVAGASV
jgi:chromosome segregation ATPase